MKKLCIIFGGCSSEHDISIITAMQLKKNYEAVKNIEMIYMGLDNKFYLATNVDNLSGYENKDALNLKEIFILGASVYKRGIAFKKLFDIDCVINCCHGGVGENGDLAGFFNVNGIRFTSANSLSAHIAMNKNLTKQIVESFVPVIKGVLINQSNYKEKCKVIEEEFSNDLIVKPNSLGSSIGVKACTKQNFAEQVQAIFEMNDDALVEERVIDISEYNQACFKDGEEFVLSAIENPITKSEFLTFEDKYKTPSKTKGKDREIPAKISNKMEEQINSYTKAIYSALNMNGVARIDYIYDKKKKQLYFNEINAIPGSMSFYLYEPIGIDYISLINTIISNATVPENYKYFNTDILKDKKI